MRTEIETLAEFDAHVAAHGSLRGCVLQALDLSERQAVLVRVDVHNALLLGCRLPTALADVLTRRGASVFPRLPAVPFDAYRAGLYTADELYRGLEDGYPGTPDGATYAWTLSPAARWLDASLARALHDHSIGDALAEVAPEPAAGVGIMGGHALARGSADYAAAARLAWHLTGRGRRVITGGGPGAMEAANLGAALAGDLDDLAAACAALGRAPGFADGVEPWARAALEVRDRWNCSRPSLGVPTWFYGHEPPNVFATHIAKYFDNALREDVLLSLCGGGIVFLRGAAGTVQEIFQAATRDYYARDAADLRPLVLVGVDYWTDVLPAWPLLATLSRDRLMAGHVYLVEDVEQALAVLT
nr:Rossmann fold nucleotide-binding protein [Propionibacterium sp.]